MEYKNKEEFKEYLRLVFDISPEAHRLISNILDYVEKNIVGENEQHLALCELLDCTIGLSEWEIKNICL